MKQRARSLKSTRTATGSHPKINRVGTTAVLLLFAAGCSPRISPEERYRHAVQTFQQGELAPALAEARAGAAASRSRSASFYNFRLLEAEILIYQGNSQAAGAILLQDIPDKPQFAGPRARLTLLRSYVLPSRSTRSEER